MFFFDDSGPFKTVAILILFRLILKFHKVTNIFFKCILEELSNMHKETKMNKRFFLHER